MEAAYFVPIFMLFLILYILYITKRDQSGVIIRKLIKKRRMEDRTGMWELANKFKGKECIVYTFNSQISGIIKEVENGAVMLEHDGSFEAVNFDYIVRIREYPRKKNGKKKSVVLD